MKFNYDMRICPYIINWNEALQGAGNVVKILTTQPPLPPGGQKYCAFVYCTFVQGEGNCMTGLGGAERGWEGSGEGWVGVGTGGEGFLRRSKRRQYLPKIYLGHKKFRLFFFNRPTDRQNDRPTDRQTGRHCGSQGSYSSKKQKYEEEKQDKRLFGLGHMQ